MLGITTLNAPDDINLSPLGMGGTNGGINTYESAAAFAVFGNKGLYYKPTFYTKVCDQYGEVILEKKVKPTVAIGEDTATIMNKLLQNVVYGAQGTGAQANNYIKDMKFYAKTGTTNDQNDLLCCLMLVRLRSAARNIHKHDSFENVGRGNAKGPRGP